MKRFAVLLAACILPQAAFAQAYAEILPPAQTVEKIRADYAKWGRVVKEANIRAE